MARHPNRANIICTHFQRQVQRINRQEQSRRLVTHGLEWLKRTIIDLRLNRRPRVLRAEAHVVYPKDTPPMTPSPRGVWNPTNYQYAS